MIIELQIDSDPFLKSFRETARRMMRCELSEGSFGTARYVISGYTLGETKLRRAKNAVNVCIHSGDPKVVSHRPVKRPELVQIVTVHIAWESDLRANNTKPSQLLDLHLPLVFEIGTATCGDQRLLCFYYTGLEGITDDPLSSLIGGKLKAPPCIKLPVEGLLGAYMPEKVPLVNAHCTVVESFKCLVIRMEFWSPEWGAATAEVPRALPEWEQFYTGHIKDRLTRTEHTGTGDPVRDGWSIFVDERALTHFVKRMVSDSMKGDPDITVLEQPVATWHDWYLDEAIEANRIHVEFEVRQKDACWCLTEDLDVDAEVKGDVVIQVPAEDTVRIDIYMDVYPDWWDSTCCTLTAGLFWPIVGLGLHAQGEITAEKFMLGLIPVAAFIGAVMEFNDAGTKLKPFGGFKKDEAWDEDHEGSHFYSENKLPMPGGVGKMSLQGAFPLNDPVGLKARGLYLHGALEVTSPPQPVLANPILEPFCWGKGGRCSRRMTASTRFRLYPTRPGDWALLQVCQPNDVRVIDDPMSIFKVEVTREEHGFADVIVRVDFMRMNAEYWKPGKSYPCKLMLKTTGGVRILTLPPLPQISQQQYDALMKEMQFEFVNECYYPRHRLFEELEWPMESLIEDPGLYHWQLRAVGLPPGERVELLDDRGRFVGRFMVRRTGMLVVTGLGTIRSNPASVIRSQSIHSTEQALLPSDAPGADEPATSDEQAPSDDRQAAVGAPTAHEVDAHQMESHGSDAEEGEGLRVDGHTASTPTTHRPNDPSIPAALTLRRPYRPLMHHHHIPIGIEEGPAFGDVRQPVRPVCGPAGEGSPESMTKIKALKTAGIVAGGHDDHGGGKREVMIRQTQLREAGRVEAPADLLSLAFVHGESGTLLLVVTPGQVQGWELSEGTPRRGEAWRVEGVRGAVAFADRLIFWGDGGLWLAGDEPPAVPPFTPCAETAARAVRGVVVAGQRLVALHSGELRVYDFDLCEISCLSTPAEQLALAGDSVVLREPDGLRFVDPAEHRAPNTEHPSCGNVLQLRGVTHIETPAVPLGDAVYVRGPEGGFLVTSSGERLAEWDGPAWFEGVVRSGKVFAMPDGRGARIIEAVRSVQSE